MVILTRRLLTLVVLQAVLTIGCAGTRPSRGIALRHSATESTASSNRQIDASTANFAGSASSKSSSPKSDEDDSGQAEVTLASATSADDVNSGNATTGSLPPSATAEPGAGGATNATLEPSPYPLNLGDILHIADSQNPNVALARERIQEAYARVDRAEALWLPSLRTGMNYNHHEGAIQSVAGDVFQTNRSAFGGGLGAGMYGAASPTVPGLIAQFHLSDAIFQPKIAAHQAASRQFGAVAARNDVLRDAAIGYLELVRAEQGMVIVQTAFDNTRKLTELTRQYAETGQGLQADHQRMEAELALRRDGVVNQQELIQVASARLAQILHGNPSILITTNEPTVTPLDIMAVEDTAASYVVLGLSRRPELAEQKHLVCEAVERLNREKYAPLIPSVLLGMSYGGMGGGLNNNIINSSQRWDADAVAYWELRNLGFGDQAARGETASAARQAQMKELAILDKVAREVVEAHTQVVQRKQRLEIARQGIVAAEKSYNLNQQRIDNAQGLPIEVLQSIQALANAQKAYLNAVVDYNIAQFELSRATGWFVES